MRKSVLIGLLFSIVGCNTAEKPKNLIERDKMIDVLYDMSLLEAIKTQNINGGISNKDANEYVYKKYKIDSLQFAESNKYYAFDLDEYKKMFDEVKTRLQHEIQKTGGSNQVNPDTPQVQ